MRTLKDRVEECTRRHPGVTQADIARAAGIKQPSVTDWFNGKTVSLKLKPAVKAAALWGCDPLWLGEGEGLPGWVDAAPAESPPTSLGQALERLGIELAKPMADDVRQDVADTLAKLAHRKGLKRHQEELQSLLSAPREKRQAGT